MPSITRRDFLDGAALALGSGIAPATLFAQGNRPAPAPPALTGWRGSTPQAYAVAHGIRDGRRYAFDGHRVEESYDVVVIGSGIGGLAAAHFHRQRRPRARVLILENHDDFGGHARRNEFEIDGRLLIGYGGSESLQSPGSAWSAEALGLLRDLGVNLARFETAFQRNLYPGLGLSRGVFFDREAFGVDRLLRGDPMPLVADYLGADQLNSLPIESFIGDFPLPERQRMLLLELFTSRRDVLAGQSQAQKEATLARTSYRDFVRRHWGLDEAAANSFHGRLLDFFAVGSDLMPAHDAMRAGYPGFAGLGLATASRSAQPDEPYIHHFPDGNASLARLLVRSLMPGVAPGAGMEDIVTARFDYSKLDAADAAVRLRLGSTVVALRNAAQHVDVGYVRAGTFRRVRAGHVIHAGYASMLPHLLPTMPAQQKAALAGAVKGPIVYVNVLVRNWQPWVRLGVHEITCPMSFFTRAKLDYPVSLGSYRCPSRPEEPMVLHLVHVPAVPPGSGLDQRAAWRAARTRLYAATFDDFERRVRDQLARMLGAGGFDADRDIRAITVNRWGHGYAYGFNSLFDDEAQFGAQLLSRRAVGRIAIAGSDAAWSAYAHAAIDQAHRAVGEIT